MSISHTRYWKLVQTLLILAGIVLVLLSALLSRPEALQRSLLALGISLLSGSFVAVLQTKLGADIPSVLEHRLTLNRQISDVGLSAVYKSLGDESVYDMLASARSIDMLYNTGKDTVHRYRTRLRDAIKSGCHIRIVLSDPDSPIWQLSNTAAALCPGIEILKDVSDSIHLVEQLKTDIASDSLTGSLEIRLHQPPPTTNMLLIDRTLLRYVPYLPYTHSSEVPVYDAVITTKPGITQKYIESFEHVWDNSRTVLMIRGK